MHRGAFVAEFKDRMRFVLQKVDRLGKVKKNLDERGEHWGRQQAYDEAHINLEAAIDLFAEHVWDGMEHLARPRPPLARNECTPRTTELL